MPLCRKCGNQVGSNGFCHYCMCYTYVVEKLDDSDIERLEVKGDANLATGKRYYKTPKKFRVNVPKNTDEKNIKCPYCKKMFVCDNDKNNHVKMVHHMRKT